MHRGRRAHRGRVQRRALRSSACVGLGRAARGPVADPLVAERAPVGRRRRHPAARRGRDPSRRGGGPRVRPGRRHALGAELRPARDARRALAHWRVGASGRGARARARARRDRREHARAAPPALAGRGLLHRAGAARSVRVAPPGGPRGARGVARADRRLGRRPRRARHGRRPRARALTARRARAAAVRLRRARAHERRRVSRGGRRRARGGPRREPRQAGHRRHGHHVRASGLRRRDRREPRRVHARLHGRGTHLLPPRLDRRRTASSGDAARSRSERHARAERRRARLAHLGLACARPEQAHRAHRRRDPGAACAPVGAARARARRRAYGRLQREGVRARLAQGGPRSERQDRRSALRDLRARPRAPRHGVPRRVGPGRLSRCDAAHLVRGGAQDGARRAGEDRPRDPRGHAARRRWRGRPRRHRVGRGLRPGQPRLARGGHRRGAQDHPERARRLAPRRGARGPPHVGARLRQHRRLPRDAGDHRPRRGRRRGHQHVDRVAAREQRRLRRARDGHQPPHDAARHRVRRRGVQRRPGPADRGLTVGREPRAQRRGHRDAGHGAAAVSVPGLRQGHGGLARLRRLPPLLQLARAERGRGAQARSRGAGHVAERHPAQRSAGGGERARRDVGHVDGFARRGGGRRDAARRGQALQHGAPRRAARDRRPIAPPRGGRWCASVRRHALRASDGRGAHGSVHVRRRGRRHDRSARRVGGPQARARNACAARGHTVRGRHPPRRGSRLRAARARDPPQRPRLRRLAIGRERRRRARGPLRARRVGRPRRHDELVPRAGRAASADRRRRSARRARRADGAAHDRRRARGRDRHPRLARALGAGRRLDGDRLRRRRGAFCPHRDRG